MLSEFTRGGSRSQSKKKDQEALGQGTVTTTGTEITGGEVAAGAEIGRTGAETVAGTEIPAVEAEVTAEALTTRKMLVGDVMMMSGGAEAEAVLMEVPLLVEIALVLGEAPLPEHLLGVKVLEDLLLRDGLQLQRMFHLVIAELIPVVSLLVNLMEMSK